MKNVLIIAYGFPPLTSAGVYRTLKIVRYLHLYGWRPVVLTVRDGVGRGYDAELLEKVPGDVIVERTSWIDPRMRNRRGGGSREPSRQARGEVRPALRARPSVMTSLKHLVDAAVLVPDEAVGWVPFVVRAGLRIAKRETVDLIYATGGPFSAHIAGYLIHRGTGLPLVVDYRDPWTFNALRPSCSGLLRLRTGLELRLERRILSAAARIIVNTPAALTEFRRRFASIPDRRFVSVPNSYDGDDFDDSVQPNGTRFVITYLGATRLANPAPFLMALQRMLDDIPSARSNIVFRCFCAADSEMQSLIDDLGLENVVELRGFLPHSRAIEEMERSSLLLLLLDDFEGADLIVPAKLYEYLAAERPVLAIVPKGPAADIVLTARVGAVVHPDDIEGITNEIERLYQEFLSGKGTLAPNREIIRRYEAREMTRQIGSILDESASQREGAPARSEVLE